MLDLAWKPNQVQGRRRPDLGAGVDDDKSSGLFVVAVFFHSPAQNNTNCANATALPFFFCNGGAPSLVQTQAGRFARGLYLHRFISSYPNYSIRCLVSEQDLQYVGEVTSQYSLCPDHSSGIVQCICYSVRLSHLMLKETTAAQQQLIKNGTYLTHIETGHLSCLLVVREEPKNHNTRVGY